MIYTIAGLRIQIENRYAYTDKFCEGYLSDDQTAPVDITARVTEAELAAERAASVGFSEGYIENICLYRSLCVQLPRQNRMLLHGAVLEYKGNGYAFLGKSGTGKSTHAKLWKRFLATPRMINGDKPILEATAHGFTAYGTPWRGKENWGENRSAPLKGLLFLEQAKENSLRRLSAADVPSRLFGQLLLPQDEENAAATLELADKLIRETPAYLLRCDISEEAVKLSFEALTGLEYEKEIPRHED